jgi:outer membrane protein OmpA-like peptidoglycan-associated protein
MNRSTNTSPKRAVTPTTATVTVTALAALLLVAACSTPKVDNANLIEVRQAYQAAQNNPQARDRAAAELVQAGIAVTRANEAFQRGDKTSEVDHLAYLARQKIAVAQESGRQKAAEALLQNAEAERDRTRLAARTDEADSAQRSALAAQLEAQTAQRVAEASQRSAMESRRAADLARSQTLAAQDQAAGAQARTGQLEAQLREINAKPTERGMVVTIGDVLFDTGRADLKAGSERNMDKLVGFLKAYPERKALVEGFTDSVGGEGQNQALSSRRADAVRSALVNMGVARERIDARGYGEAFPVAGNDNASGRQMNRRVEIVLSDEAGRISPR